MKKRLFPVMAVSALMTLSSCFDSNDSKSEQPFTSTMVVATCTPDYNVSCATNELAYVLDGFHPERTRLQISKLNLGSTTTSGVKITNMTYGLANEGMGFSVTPNATTQYEGFGGVTVDSYSGFISGYYPSIPNISYMMKLSDGTTLVSFSRLLRFFSQTTVSTLNADVDPYITKGGADNSYLIEVKEDGNKANVYVDNAIFSEKMPRKVNFVLENVPLQITSGGLMLLKVDEIVPKLANNHVAGDPYPQFTIKNFRMQVFCNFTYPATATFDCADAYSVSSTLTGYVVTETEDEK